MKRTELRKISSKQEDELYKRRILKACLIIESGDKCMTCGQSGGWLGLSLSHIIPLSRGGKTFKENCLVECSKCHMHRHNLRVANTK